MELDELALLHIPRRAAVEGASALPEMRAFAVSTCLRQLLVMERRALAGPARAALPDHAELLAGRRAYARLLEIACGLHSSVAGETEIFHQIKAAWAAFEACGGSLASALRPWMQRLFEDVKAIRSQHLRDTGGGSYGSLVRRLLGETEVRTAVEKPTLLIGAGALGRSIAPWLARGPLEVWNRSGERLAELVRAAPQGATIRALPCDSASELAAWDTAARIVLCIPQDATLDAGRVQRWSERAARGRAPLVVHLGIERPCGAWGRVSPLRTLTDLFALDAAQRHRRAQQLAAARLDCDARSRRRVLGVTSTPHGWEDLPL